MDWHGGFTAGAGHALYTARAYPSRYWNQTAFVAEPTGHLVAAFTLHRTGSDVAAYYGWNLVASDDEWTSPIAAEVGPDGHVWVIDWYNYIVQHNPTPKGFRTGRGAAYETPLRDKTHGRIYRIVYKDAQVSPNPALDPNDPKGLVAALGNDTQFWRMHAQRLLVERAKTDVVPALIERVADRSVDAIGLNAGVIHALWTLHGLGAARRLEPGVEISGDGRAGTSLGGSAAQCRASPAARCVIGNCRAGQGSAVRPRRAGPPGGAPGPGGSTAVGRSRHRAGDFLAKRSGPQRSLDLRRGHGRRGPERPGLLEGNRGNVEVPVAPARRCWRLPSVWPSTGPAAVRSMGSARSWRH